MAEATFIARLDTSDISHIPTGTAFMSNFRMGDQPDSTAPPARNIG